MKERPILFSAPMVRAILAGTKTQTRRAVRKQFAPDALVAEVPATTPEGWQVSGHSGLWWDDAGACLDDAVRCPYGMPGDRLWVRETFKWDMNHKFYRADEQKPGELSSSMPWLPSIHMPRWASRITLQITGVRVERLQDISRGDAMAEGCPFPNMAAGPDPSDWYRELWNEINGLNSWTANPWVWVVEFKRVKP